MKTPTRLLLGTLATAAALSGAAASAHADAADPSGSADVMSSPVDSLVCPMMAPGSLVWGAVNDLNSESAARACRG
ncbi:hypothetical protein ABIA31_006601 [Catenulispora sp. MAP5-51]|uniref:hypothetical protein n=1 Tax=Catenulispora sp. MAP5-51 TaxID=3156298 RepID=UPI0035189EA4